MYNWKLLDDAPADFYNKHPELPPIIVRLLWNRNLKTQKEIDEFLNPDYSQDIHDPFLFKDMKKALKIIFRAIQKQKNIVIHGDYDADGVCASAILIKTLKVLGAKNVSIFIPHREIDGYGVNMNTIEEFHKEKKDLLITCDCGISNIKEIKKAKEYKMEVIITDHHTVPEKKPNADAIIHPKVKKEKYPDKDLCGAGVAFKLVQGLLIEHKKKNETLPNGVLHEAYEKWMLDLVALATVGDMIPLYGESRTLTLYGLIVLNKTQNIGLKHLLQACSLSDENKKLKRKLTTQSLGYQIIPRINAAGRMDHANTAFALLMAEDDREAKELAQKLDQNNKDRQKLTEVIIKEAKAQIEEIQKDNPILFAIKEGWPTGILGLVAGKIKDMYNKPVIIMGITNGEITGSGRSIKEIDIIEMLQEVPELFTKFGGHPQACGLTLRNPDKLEQFKKILIKKVKTKIHGKKLIPEILIDAKVELEDVDWKLYDLLQKFEPFGQENEEPKYMAKELTVTSIEPVGQTGKHLRILVKHNSDVVRKTIGFGLGDTNRHPEDWRKNLKVGNKIDMVFNVGVNEWNGNRELQLTVQDIKKSK